MIAEVEIAEMIHSCLPGLDEIEAAYIQDCCLQEPGMPVALFSRQWHLSTKAVKKLQTRALLRLRDLMAKRGFTSIADIV